MLAALLSVFTATSPTAVLAVVGALILGATIPLIVRPVD